VLLVAPVAVQIQALPAPQVLLAVMVELVPLVMPAALEL
jgi:hypothetical protein